MVSYRGKRALDVVGVLLLGPLALPICLLAAMAIRIEDGGPALFRQVRIGRDGHPFRVLKLRTMIIDADDHLDGSGLPTRVRTTRVGRLLRATSIDELPQLLNVLRGEMSLVGPRPMLPERAALLSGEDRRRLSVRPGITGLAQVSGRNRLSWPERIQLDLEYVAAHDAVGDLAILIQTLGKVATGKGLAMDRGVGSTHRTSEVCGGGE